MKRFYCFILTAPIARKRLIGQYATDEKALIYYARKSSIICYEQCSYISKIMPVIMLVFVRYANFR